MYVNAVFGKALARRWGSSSVERLEKPKGAPQERRALFLLPSTDGALGRYFYRDRWQYQIPGPHRRDGCLRKGTTLCKGGEISIGQNAVGAKQRDYLNWQGG